MPSPVGHTLAGCCVAAAAAGRSPRFVAAVLLAANLPDLDFLGGLARPFGLAIAHQGPTHSLAFVATAAALLALALRRDARPHAAFGWLLAAGAAHLLLDFFNFDDSPPIGIPFLWPLSEGYVHSPLVVFPGVDRDHPLSLHNVRELLVELAVTLPLLALLLRRRLPRPAWCRR